MSVKKDDRIFFVILLTILGVISLVLIFIPPFFKEGGLIGAGILLLIAFFSLTGAFMIHRG